MKKINAFPNTSLAIFFACSIIVNRLVLFGIKLDIVQNVVDLGLIIFLLLKIIFFFINLISSPSNNVNSLKEKYIRIKNKANRLKGIKYIFISFLLTMILITFDFKKYQLLNILFKDIEVLKAYEPFVIIMVFTTGCISIFKHRKKLRRKIEIEKKSNLLNKSANPLILLFVILISFTLIKIPYFDTTFTGEHPTKYMAYVDPAINMLEHNNPFWMQRKYRVDPVSNPQGIYKTFSSPPLHEWGIFLTLKMFPNNSIETNARLFTHLLGILILLFSYVSFSKLLSSKLSLLITYLISLNPIINIFTFSTVADTWAILFMFVSLMFLTDYIKNNNFTFLYAASIFFGLGNLSKYSLFLWYAPISIYLITTYSTKLQNETEKKILDIGILISLSLAPILLWKTSLKYLPSKPYNSLFKFIVGLSLFILVYFTLNSKYKGILSLFKKTAKKRIFLVFLFVATVATSAYFIKISDLDLLVNNFLTDKYLLLNFKMYSFMLNSQFKNYMSTPIFWFGLLGLVSMFLVRIKSTNKIATAFLSGNIIYWILASKSIFFHNYYTSIIMITFSLLSALTIIYVDKLIENLFLRLGILSFILISIFLETQSISTRMMSKEEPINQVNEVVNYLYKNCSENDIYIDEKWNYRYITLASGFPQTNIDNLNNRKIKNSIEERGFQETMQKYNICCLITQNETPLYDVWISLFTDENLKTLPYNRTSIILDKVSGKEMNEDNSVPRYELINKYSIPEKFILKEEIGAYKIFNFVN